MTILNEACKTAKLKVRMNILLKSKAKSLVGINLISTLKVCSYGNRIRSFRYARAQATKKHKENDLPLIRHKTAANVRKHSLSWAVHAETKEKKAGRA